MKIHNDFRTPGSRCARYTLLLPQLHQNTLDGDVEASLRAHLGSCAYCQAQLSAYDQLDASLRSYIDDFAPMAPSAEDLVRMSVAGVSSVSPGTSSENAHQIEPFTLDVEDMMTSEKQETKSFPDAAPAPAVPALSAHRLRRRATGVMAIAAVLLIMLLSGTIFTLFGRYHASVGAEATATVPAIPATVRDSQTGLPAHWEISSIQVLAPDDVWAVGDYRIISGSRVTQIWTLFAHFDGHKWRAVPGKYPLGLVPTGTEQPGGGLTGTVPTGTEQPGGGCTNDIGSVFTISMDSPTDGWAGGNTFYHYTHGKWEQVCVPAASSGVYKIVMLSADDGWAAVNGNQAGSFATPYKFMHYQNGVWTPVTMPFSSSIADIAFDGTGHGWVVGSNGEFGSYANGQWQEEPPIPITGIDLFKITAVSPDDLWAAGKPHNATLNSPGVILHFDGHSWHQVAVPGLNGYGDGPFNEYQPPIEMVSAAEGWLSVSTTSEQGAFIARLLHYTDGQWQQVALPVRNLGIIYAAGFSTTDGWLYCTDMYGGGNGKVTMFLLRYHNGVWSVYDATAGS